MKFMNLYFFMAAKKQAKKKAKIPVKKKAKTPSKSLKKDENIIEPLIEARFSHFKSSFEQILQKEGLHEAKVLKKIYESHRYFIGTNLIFERMMTLEQEVPPSNMMKLSQKYGDESKKRLAKLRKELEDGKYLRDEKKVLTLYLNRLDNLEAGDSWITGED
jgi:hypothetical protein